MTLLIDSLFLEPLRALWLLRLLAYSYCEYRLKRLEYQLSNGRQVQKIFSSQQTSVLSAATLIMLMVIASRVLGLVRQRALAHFFTADQLSLFCRLPLAGLNL